MESMVIFWAAIMALALFAEIITADLVAVWFIPAALVSMLLAFVNAPVWSQWVAFLVLSAILLVVAFKFIRKLLFRNRADKKTDTDILLGRLARVEEDINNAEMQGAVKIDGKIWSARMADDSESAVKGEFVTVEYISGVKLICRRQK